MVIAQKVLEALIYLDKNASNPYVSLNPNSIFLYGSKAQFSIKLFNFGLFRYTTCTKSLWTAPELFCDSQPDQTAANVYAFATLLWHLIFQEQPYIIDNGVKLFESGIEISNLIFTN